MRFRQYPVKMPLDFLDMLALVNEREASWEETKYGRKATINPNNAIIEIDPGRTTAIKDIDAFGLRGHPEVLFEVIAFMDGAPGSLKYTARGKFENTPNRPVIFNPGSRFISVKQNGKGYWHANENISDRVPALLMVSQIRTQAEATYFSNAVLGTDAAFFRFMMKGQKRE